MGATVRVAQGKPRMLELSSQAGDLYTESFALNFKVGAIGRVCVTLRSDNGQLCLQMAGVPDEAAKPGESLHPDAAGARGHCDAS